MQGFLLLLSLAIWVAVWVLIVRKRGRLKLLSGNLLGAVVGFAVSTLVLAVLSPEPTQEEKVAQATQARDSDTATQRADAQKGSVPSEDIDRLVTLYIKHKIYPNDPTVCSPKMIGGRNMVGCFARGWGKSSQVHVWEYAAGKFKSINGNARALAEKQFGNEPLVAVSPLPLPRDIDVSAVVETFGKE